VEDLKGQRVRSLAGPPLKLFQALGISPVTVAMPEVFEAMQKGTIDGYSADWVGTVGFKFYQVAKYAVDVPLYPQTFFMVMNKKKWDSLPPDIQKAISDVSGMVGAEMYGAGWDKCNEDAKGVATSAGMQPLPISDTEQAKITKLAAPIWDEWVKTANSKGANGQALLDKAKNLVEKYK